MKFHKNHISISYNDIETALTIAGFIIFGGIALKIAFNYEKNKIIYLECQECKKKFITRNYIYNLGVFCPKCDSPNVGKTEKFIKT